MGSRLGQGILASSGQLSSELCCTLLSMGGQAKLLKVVAERVRPPRPLGSVCRAMAGQCSRNTEVSLGARRPLGQIR